MAKLSPAARWIIAAAVVVVVIVGFGVVWYFVGGLSANSVAQNPTAAPTVVGAPSVTPAPAVASAINPTATPPVGTQASLTATPAQAGNPNPTATPATGGQQPVTPVPTAATGAQAIFTALPPGHGNTYYVATNGSDSNTGALDAPWATLAHALPMLRPGDTLNLRAGIYYETNLTTNITGSPDNAITIQSFPGEQATIDGGVPYFDVSNNNEWVLSNPAIDEYQSVRTFTGNYVRAWLTDAKMQIFQYKKQTNMESTNYGPVNGFNPLYFGPGLQLRSDGHIYIRLSPNPTDQFDVNNKPIPPVPADVNPNHNRMDISVTNVITQGKQTLGEDVIFNSVLQNVTFQNLTVGHAEILFDLRPGSQNIGFKNSTYLYGSVGITFRDNISNVEIANDNFDNQLPYFLYWTDVKNNATEEAEGFPEFQTMAIQKMLSGSNVHDNIIQNGFDGLLAANGTNISVKNNQFLNLHDDSMNFVPGSNGEVAHNLMWHVDSGIAILGLPGTPGDLFIHHNIIDTTALRHGGRAGNYRAKDWPVWNTDTPFAKHGGGDKAAWWKLYNNTILARFVPYNLPMNPFSLEDNSHFYVVNNIFYAVDNRLIFRDHLSAKGSTYDGDVVWQGTPGGTLFKGFGDGGTYNSLAAFKAKNSSWEVHGQQVDPGFNLTAINDPAYNYPAVLSRYDPSNPAVETAGFSYAGLNWPETDGVNYAGALPVAAP